MAKVVLIDGHSIAFRAFYALPLLSNSSGLYTNAVYGFTMMLLKVLEEEKPTHALVAFDAGKTTFRHESFQDYKGKREKTPGEMTEQIPLIKELLDAFGIRHFEMNQYEADDIIGTLAKEAEKRQWETLIVSGDKDMLQLVNEQVHVLLPKKGVTDAVHYDIQAIQERYGLSPKQIIDLKGLMGDASDNIPGIPGVGEKTALKLLAQFGSVEEVVQRVDEISGKKLQEKVREYADQALLSKRLATIYTDVPLPFTMDELAIPPYERQKIEEVFRKFEFKSLLDRLSTFSFFKEEETEQEQKSVHEVEVKRIDSVSHSLLEELLEQSRLALWVEASEENPHRAEPVAIAISDGENQAYIPWEIGKSCDLLLDWLKNETKQKVVFDGKQIRILFERQGVKVSGIDFDISLAAYLLDPSESGVELSEIVHRYLHFRIPSDEEVFGKGAKRRIPSEEELAQHLARKVQMLMRLDEVLLSELEKNDLIQLMCELELPLSNVLAKMELAGMRVDQEQLEKLGQELKAKMDELTEEIYQIAGVEFNLNSPKQLGEVLFDKLNLPVIKKTKTGYSTSADVLEKLAPQHEIVEKILHYRQVGKLYTTYIEGLKKEIHPDGKVHTRFQQTVTATGRLSSTEPNLQNIPIRLEEGRRIRQVFLPPTEGWYILAADYSQIELRILAHLSEDESLQKAFQEELDIHTKTAMDVFGVSEEEVTPWMRRQAKAVNFGIIYGISPFGLSQNLNISQREAKEFIERYFATYPGVKRYMDTIIEQAKRDGYVTTLLNRRRYLPDLYSADFHRRSFAERTAMNTPIQGSAADLIKYAMVKIDQKLREQALQSRMLLQVHDELVFEVPEEEIETMKQLVKQEMEQALELSVPLKVDVQVGRNWYEAK